jgi:hypothetical protein
MQDMPIPVQVAVGPYRVTCDGSDGTHGNPGNLKSVTCRYNDGLVVTTPSSSTMCFVAHVRTQLQSTLIPVGADGGNDSVMAAGVTALA